MATLPTDKSKRPGTPKKQGAPSKRAPNPKTQLSQKKDKSAASATKSRKGVGGPPSSYTQEMADSICAGLADGKSLRTVCRQPGMPCLTTVFKWLREHPDFAQQYARAKEDGIEAMLEDCLEIADDGTNDWMTIQKGDVEIEIPNREVIDRSKLRVDTRKWFASKLKPKKYGDKIEQTVKGDKDAPLVTRVVLVPPKQTAMVAKRSMPKAGEE